MNFDEIKKEISYYREAAIDNVEYHINDHFAEDIIDAGMVDYIISDYDYYFYWMDKAKYLSDLMNRLIYDHHIQNFEKKNEDVAGKIYEYLIECVDIKRVIDKNLRDSRDFNEQEVEEWMGLEVKKELKSDFIPIMGNENIQKTISSELFKLLQSKGFINIESGNFERHFKPVSGNLSKIQWLGTEIEIVALIHLMVTKNIIPKSQQKNKAKIIANHFENKFGKEFRERQLGVVLSKVNNDEIQHQFEDMIEIVEELIKIN